MIIGDKDNFACQVGAADSMAPQYFDHFGLWCRGLFIGEPDDTDMLNMYADPLLNAYRSRMKFTPPNDLYLNPDAFFSQNVDWSGDYYKYRVPQLPLFDDFLIFLFYSDGHFHYLWRISRRFDDVDEDVLGYPKGSFSYSIPEDEFLAVALEVKEVINKIESPRGR